MTFHVLIKEITYGRFAYALFSTAEKAREFLERTTAASDTSVEEHEVFGEYDYPATVYAAHAFLPQRNAFYFSGLYADYERALREPEGVVQVLYLAPDIAFPIRP